MIFDVSEANGGEPFDTLSDALDYADSVLLDSQKKGGMTIKYIQSSDNKYVQYRLMADEWNTNTENWAIDDEDVYIDNLEFIYVKTDAEDRIIWAIKADGSIYWGAGVPQQVVDYVSKKISELSLDEYEDIVNFLGNLISGDTLTTLLNAKVNKEYGKSLIDADFSTGISYIENPDFIEVKTDAEDKIIWAIRKNGDILYGCGVPSKVKEYVDSNVGEFDARIAKIEDYDSTWMSGLENALEDDGFSDNCVTHEELEDYLKKDEATLQYATKSIEEVVQDHTSSITSIEQGIQTIEGDIDTVNSALSELSSNPPSSGAITGDNVWTGVNQFTQSIIGVSGTNDNNVALYGQFKNTLNRFVDAADYGFDPSNTGSGNAAALNTALSGGYKTVVIQKPGTYLIGDTILLYDNTTLICGNGVLLKKSDNTFTHVFLNYGAETRTTNNNITIIGVHIFLNGNGALNAVDSALYGLRGVMAFLCIKNLTIDNYTITDLGTAQYALHINTFEQVVISNCNIQGNKDGIHVSDGSFLTIRGCYLNTYDDPIALNSSDWDSSNCVDGTISYVLIENCITQTTGEGRYLMLTGAFVDWFDGMDIVRGDRVVSNGKVYRAVGIGTTADVHYTSHTQPTIDTYTGTQNDTGGFKWKLMKLSEFYRTDVKYVTIRNCNNRGNIIGVSIDTIKSGSPIWNRSIYPTVPVLNYPHVNFVVENSVFETRMMNVYPQVNVDITLNNVRLGSSFIIIQPRVAGVKAHILLDNCDFEKLANSYTTIRACRDSHFIVRGGRNINYINFYNDGYPDIRLESDYPCKKDWPTGSEDNNTAQKRGDVVKNEVGVVKMYNGNQWITLN